MAEIHPRNGCRTQRRSADRHRWSLLNASKTAVACLRPPGGHDVIWHYLDAVLEDGRF